MPAKVEFNVIVDCVKCGKPYMKNKKTGKRCRTCRTQDKKLSRRDYTICCVCGLEKPATKASICSKCHSARYPWQLSKNRIKRTQDDIDFLKKTIYRIKVKQSNYIFSLYDINDIVEAWQMFSKKNITAFDHLTSGGQIISMWCEILEIEKNYGQTKSSS